MHFVNSCWKLSFATTANSWVVYCWNDVWKKKYWLDSYQINMATRQDKDYDLLKLSARMIYIMLIVVLWWMNAAYPIVTSLRPLKYQHRGSQMIVRQPRSQAVNKLPSEDDRKPHWGACMWKTIHIHSGRAKGSIICFPCSQKFMSDGLAIGAYPLPARFLPKSGGGAEPGTVAQPLVIL